MPTSNIYTYVNICNIYTEQNYKRNNFVFAPIFHQLNSKIEDFLAQAHLCNNHAV